MATPFGEGSECRTSFATLVVVALRSEATNRESWQGYRELAKSPLKARMAFFVSKADIVGNLTQYWDPPNLAAYRKSWI